MKTSQKERLPLFDNAKVLLILLMVFGHFCFENRQYAIPAALCNVIYSFHMPLFIVISGYLSRHIVQQRKSDLTGLLFPYLIMEVFHWLFSRTSGLGYGHLQFTIPTYQNWYLLCLFFWRMIAPYMRFTSAAKGLTATVIIALGAGYVSQLGYFLALYRTCFLLPFFVLGFYSHRLPEIINKGARYKPLFTALFLLFLSGIFWASYRGNGATESLLFAFIPNTGYTDDLNLTVLRAAAIPTGIMLSMLFLCIVPARRTLYTAFGPHTMTVYLFHIFPVWIINHFLPYYPYISEVMFIIISVLLTRILLSNPVIKILQPFTDPYGFMRQFKKAT